mmetsp:Transcript_41158/g.132451  ORF Transcript_41158/g.132451 Transcript_41158/m.132451 type:complete len:289 (-) Transcript_41158:5056-5922(-)
MASFGAEHCGGPGPALQPTADPAGRAGQGCPQCSSGRARLTGIGPRQQQVAAGACRTAKRQGRALSARDAAVRRLGLPRLRLGRQLRGLPRGHGRGLAARLGRTLRGPRRRRGRRGGERLPRELAVECAGVGHPTRRQRHHGARRVGHPPPQQRCQRELGRQLVLREVGGCHRERRARLGTLRGDARPLGGRAGRVAEWRAGDGQSHLQAGRHPLRQRLCPEAEQARDGLFIADRRGRALRGRGDVEERPWCQGDQPAHEGRGLGLGEVRGLVRERDSADWTGFRGLR